VEQQDLIARLDRIIAGDPQYRVQAYLFVIDALEFTMSRLGRRGHVSGQELLDGIRDLAKREFGPTVKMVFESWGVSSTEDFGEIVFRLVESGLLGKTEDDSIEDFREVYDFREVFEKGYDWKIDGVI